MRPCRLTKIATGCRRVPALLAPSLAAGRRRRRLGTRIMRRGTSADCPFDIGVLRRSRPGASPPCSGDYLRNIRNIPTCAIRAARSCCRRLLTPRLEAHSNGDGRGWRGRATGRDTGRTGTPTSASATAATSGSVGSWCRSRCRGGRRAVGFHRNNASPRCGRSTGHDRFEPSAVAERRAVALKRRILCVGGQPNMAAQPARFGSCAGPAPECL